MHFEIKQSRKNLRWYWAARSGRHVIATCAGGQERGYQTKRGCIRAIYILHRRLQERAWPRIRINGKLR